MHPPRPAVTLREPQPGDRDILYAFQADPEGSAMADFPTRDAATYDAYWQHVTTDPTVTHRVVLADGIVAGHIVSWDDEHDRVVGYWYGREFWGRGIATEALRQYLHLDHNRPMTAYIAPHNVGSRRVLEKCGFTVTGERPGDLILTLATAALPSTQNS